MEFSLVIIALPKEVALQFLSVICDQHLTFEERHVVDREISQGRIRVVLPPRDRYLAFHVSFCSTFSKIGFQRDLHTLPRLKL